MLNEGQISIYYWGSFLLKWCTIIVYRVVNGRLSANPIIALYCVYGAQVRRCAITVL